MLIVFGFSWLLNQWFLLFLWVDPKVIPEDYASKAGIIYPGAGCTYIVLLNAGMVLIKSKAVRDQFCLY